MARLPVQSERWGSELRGACRESAQDATSVERGRSGEGVSEQKRSSARRCGKCCRHDQKPKPLPTTTRTTSPKLSIPEAAAWARMPLLRTLPTRHTSLPKPKLLPKFTNYHDVSIAKLASGILGPDCPKSWHGSLTQNLNRHCILEAAASCMKSIEQKPSG